MDDVITLASDALPASLRVVGFRGREALNELYSFDVFVTLDDADSADLEMGTAIGQRASLALDRHDGTDPLRWNGVLAGLELMIVLPDSRGLYKLVLVPKVWLLTQSRHSRIFTDKSVRDILDETLKDAGFTSDDYAIKLSVSYVAEEHVCQYKESDFAFLSRWMEREGITYFFEQGDDKEKLIITDDKATHEALRDAAVPYHPVLGDDVSAGEAFHTFAATVGSLPKSIKLKDYDYLKPSLDLSSKADVAIAGGAVVDYGARFFTQPEGARLTKVAAGALLATQTVITAEGSPWYLRPGYTFEVEEHPRPAYNARYLTTVAEHMGNQGAMTAELKKVTGLLTKQVYVVKVHAISADTQYRPLRSTPWPRIYGVEGAMVDGPADSDYAQIDKHGRYHVKFLFDESDLDKGHASTWIRMLQPHAGNPEGFHFPLRKGTEVLLVFLGGDPDRPVIAGAVPNMPNPSPVTESNYTQNVVHTGGNTRIEIEDKAGAQYIDISTPPKDTYIHLGEPHGKHTHYIVEHTDGDCLFDIGGNQDIEVGGDLTEHVAGDVTENYDNDQDTVVGGDKTLEVGGDWDSEITGDVTMEAGGDWDVEIGGDITFEAGGDWDSEIGGDVTLEAGGDWDAEIGGDVTLEAGGDWDAEIGGDVTLEAGGDVSWEIGGGVTWEVSGNIEITAPQVTVNTPKWEVHSPDEGWITAMFKFILGDDTEVVGYKSEVVGISIGITGFKAELTGISLGATGFKAETTGVVAEHEGVDLKEKGLTLKTVGLNFITAGLYSVL